MSDGTHQGVEPAAKDRIRVLRLVKLVHTVAWAFFAGCILAIPYAAWVRSYGFALVLAGIVLVEVLILGWNDWRCPLTPIAARYTSDRQPNFDIYLPLWLARYNKHIFGSLFLFGLVFLAARWVGWV